VQFSNTNIAISAFLREVDEKWALPGHYAASSYNVPKRR